MVINRAELSLRRSRAFLPWPDFISIDCGIPANQTYPDRSVPGIVYVSDAGFIDAGAGLTAGVKPTYIGPNLHDRYRTLRYFPGGAGARSCYTLRPVTPGGKYLVKVSFFYGNYDGLNEPPVFDIHFGANRWWTTLQLITTNTYSAEAVTVPPGDSLQASRSRASIHVRSCLILLLSKNSYRSRGVRLIVTAAATKSSTITPVQRDPPPCSFDLSATSQPTVVFFQNKPANQQYFSLRTNQHRPSATSQTNRLHEPRIPPHHLPFLSHEVWFDQQIRVRLYGSCE
jgi:hypothetical protein